MFNASDSVGRRFEARLARGWSVTLRHRHCGNWLAGMLNVDDGVGRRFGHRLRADLLGDNLGFSLSDSFRLGDGLSRRRGIPVGLHGDRLSQRKHSIGNARQRGTSTSTGIDASTNPGPTDPVTAARIRISVRTAHPVRPRVAHRPGNHGVRRHAARTRSAPNRASKRARTPRLLFRCLATGTEAPAATPLTPLTHPRRRQVACRRQSVRPWPCGGADRLLTSRSVMLSGRGGRSDADVALCRR